MDLYSPFIVTHPKGTPVLITQFYLHTCVYLVSLHQTEPRLIVLADIKLQLTTPESSFVMCSCLPLP